MDNKERRTESMDRLRRELKARDRKKKMSPLGMVATTVVILVVFVGGIVYLATRGHESTDNQASSSSTTSSAAPTTPADQHDKVLAMKRTTPLPPTVTCDYTPNKAENNPRKPGLPDGKDVATTGTKVFALNTSDGPIDVTLDQSTAPCASHSFEFLAQKHYFDGTICHRITTEGIKVLQCGDPTGTGTGGPGYTFKDEYPVDESHGSNTPVIYPRGSVAMANSGPSTNGSQFFLNYGDSPLPPKYTYIGKVDAEGLKTLDKIAARGAVGGATDGKPAKEVKIETATIK